MNDSCHGAVQKGEISEQLVWKLLGILKTTQMLNFPVGRAGTEI